MDIESVFFYIFALLAVVSALMVITRKNPLKSALWLVACFVVTAALFALLRAHFLAVIQLMVYAGAIMVLVIFVIMLLDLTDKEMEKDRLPTVRFVSMMVLAGLCLAGLWGVFLSIPGKNMVMHSDFGTIEAVGWILFRDYLLPFEVASILLLAAIVGAVVMAKRRL